MNDFDGNDEDDCEVSTPFSDSGDYRTSAEVQSILDKYRHRYGEQLTAAELAEVTLAANRRQEIRNRCSHVYEVILGFALYHRVCCVCGKEDQTYNRYS
jgi:hypothetical protein